MTNHLIDVKKPGNEFVAVHTSRRYKNLIKQGLFSNNDFTNKLSLSQDMGNGNKVG